MPSFDFVLFGAVLVLMGIGILFIYSSGINSSGVQMSREFLRQIVWGVTGVALMTFFAFFSYTTLRMLSLYIYAGGLLLLLITLAIGREVNGARSWLGFSEIGIQPAEFVKIATILFLATYLTGIGNGIKELPRFLLGLCIVLVPIALILMQPDMGEALAFVPIFLLMAFIGGAQVRHLLFILFAGVFAFMLAAIPTLNARYGASGASLFSLISDPDILKYLLLAGSVVAGLAFLGWRSFRQRYFFWIAWAGALLVLGGALSLALRQVLKDYQIMRLVIFVDPKLDPQGAGWNIIQSVTAIGSGGPLGKGFLHGTQSHYQFLPQRSTDFIFSILAEEWGFLGALLVFALFLIILLRGISIVWASREDYAMLCGTGILAMVFFHTLVNAGHGHGHHADHGDSAHVPLLWRLLPLDGAHWNRHPHEYQPSQTAILACAIHVSGRDLVALLRKVEKPGRYVGGEFGAVSKPDPSLKVALSYPDLYEIGMSNAAIRILYSLLNGIPGVSCERVFAPAPDFEDALRGAGLPLFSLESGRPLSEFDIIGFSIGHELTLTNLCAILESGGVEIESARRGAGQPIVIAGGPAATNPVPLGLFVDAVFIGEAEGWVEPVFSELAVMKRKGAARQDMLAYLRSQPCIWFPGKTGRVGRALWRGFAETTAVSLFPVPSMRVVQDHGTVEIMRGCPNACRFCHATVYARPCRFKLHEMIREEVQALVERAGYRQVTLSSLSSGDFRGIHGLVRDLNARYAPLQVSFSLPSLRIDSLSLALLKEISEVRKSGLTFAVETAKPEWQQEVRKTATLEKIISVMREAKTQGWKAAKFYFMVGLPPSFGDDESTSIIEYMRAVRAATGMSINVNIAAFIPKPHTPWQRAAQLGEEDASARIRAVRKGLAGQWLQDRPSRAFPLAPGGHCGARR